jgi:hypothetical protein
MGYNRGMNIGLDIHGVIDKYPKLFAELSKGWAEAGHYVYIITGEPEGTARPTVDEAGVTYDGFYSIVDYHIWMKTPSLRQDDKGHYWVDRHEWLPTKGQIAKEVGIDIHFDDQIEYAEYFPRSCSFIYVPPVNFDLVLDTISII